MTRRDYGQALAFIAAGILTGSALGAVFLGYAEWRDANTPLPGDCFVSQEEPVKITICNLPDHRRYNP